MNVPQQMKGAGHRGSIYGQATIANTRSCSILPAGTSTTLEHLWRVDNHKATDPSASA